MVGPRAFYNRVGLGISSFDPRLIHFFRLFLHSRDVTFKLLKESTLYYGYNPRRCFDVSYSRRRLKAKKMDVVQVITHLASNPSELLRVLHDRRANAEDVSHTIFQVIPMDESRQYETSECVPASKWILNSLVEACERNKAESIARLYRSLSGSPLAATLRGSLLEKLVQKSLDDIKSDANLKIRGLTDANQTNWVYHGPIPRFTFR